MKNSVRGIIKWILILFGITIIVYPSVSQFLSSKNASKAIASYDDTMAMTDEVDRRAEFEQADLYNKALFENKKLPDYNKLLNLNYTGMMGYITIPRLNIRIPFYHGTAETILQKGIGHLKESSLPVGGSSTHAVLTGHSGLPGANLFTGLDKLKEGDTFSIKVLDREINYLIDDIKVVLPDEVDALAIEKDKDYVTLITCVPYGINSHRLLVRGIRTGDTVYPTDIPIIERINQIPMQYKHLFLGICLIIVILIIRFIFRKIKNKIKNKVKK